MTEPVGEADPKPGEHFGGDVDPCDLHIRGPLENGRKLETRPDAEIEDLDRLLRHRNGSGNCAVEGVERLDARPHVFVVAIRPPVEEIGHSLRLFRFRHRDLRRIVIG